MKYLKDTQYIPLILEGNNTEVLKYTLVIYLQSTMILSHTPASILQLIKELSMSDL